MRLYYSYLLSLLFAFAISSCSKNDDSDINNGGSTDTRVTTDEIYYANKFAGDVLSDIYLWNKEIKSDLTKLDPNTNTDPISTVKDIRYKQNGADVDKWTQLTNDYSSFTSSLAGVETTYGYDVMLGQFSNTKNYFFIITFVYDNSPAKKAGIKRGDIIIKIDDKDITKDNYLNALYSSSVKLGMGINTESGISAGSSINLTAVKMYEDPVLLSKIFEFGGKKAGYLAYASFDMISVPKLISICKEYKAAGVTELILDLRYNGGGYVVTEEAMASMFAPESEVKAKALYQTEIWNEEYTAYFKQKGTDLNTYFKTSFSIKDEYNILSTVSTDGANIGLKKIYAIISSGTASASESLIIGLMPFMDVELIGEQSHGKYCTGSVLNPSDIYDKVPSSISNWGIYVMINRYADKNGNNPCMPNGLTPDIAVDDNPFDGHQLGDEQETMLKVALTKAGKTDIPTVKSRSVSLPDYSMKHISTRSLDGKRISTRPLENIKK